MFKTILICADGSDQALQAARAGAQIARRFDADVRLVSVFDMSSAVSTPLGAWTLSIDPDVLDRLANQAHEEAEQDTNAVLAEAGVPYQVRRETGHPVARIVSVAEQEHADMIVLGRRGLSGWKALLLGSVSDGVLHHAHCPILVVPGESSILKRILLASDGSDGASRAAKYAAALANHLHASLTVLNVFEPMRSYPGVSTEILDTDVYAWRVMEAVKQSVADAFEGADIEPAFRQADGHPAEMIVRVASEEACDLIVLGSRGMGGFKSLLLGSVADRVVHHAGCPVLVVR